MDNMDSVSRKRLMREDRARHSCAEFNDVMSAYSGRAVMSDILEECGLFSSIPSDTFSTHRALGKRDIGLWLRDKLLTVNSKSVILMENEARKRYQDLNT